MNNNKIITSFTIDSDFLEQFVHQNNAKYIECIEGCLLDNYVLACNRGTAFIYEQYVNEWTSNYRVEFYKKGHEEEGWDKWYNFEENII